MNRPRRDINRAHGADACLLHARRQFRGERPHALEPSLDVLAGINRFTGGRPATGDTTDWRRKADSLAALKSSLLQLNAFNTREQTMRFASRSRCHCSSLFSGGVGGPEMVPKCAYGSLTTLMVLLMSCPLCVLIDYRTF